MRSGVVGWVSGPGFGVARGPETTKPALGGPLEVARPEGLEPSTIDVEDRCSIQLSYGRRNQRLALRWLDWLSIGDS
jgi:hypothetical protein